MITVKSCSTITESLKTILPILAFTSCKKQENESSVVYLSDFNW